MRKFALMMVFLVGCASGEAVSPLERAVGAGQEKIGEGREQGQQDADVVRGVFLRVRYNPAGCEVPSFEVFSYERWARVFFEGNEEITAALRDFERDFEAGGAVLSVRSFLEVSGKYTGRRRTAAGVRYPVFTISDLREASVANGGARAGAEPFEGVDEPRACL